MFTDDRTTPARVETLIDLVRADPKRRWTDDLVSELLQPDGLPVVKDSRSHAAKMILAAEELGLVERGKETLRLTFPAADARPTRAIICDAIDAAVLGRLDAEPYFAPYYSFLLGLGLEADTKRPREEWVELFRTAYPPAAGQGGFNTTKLTGLNRWFSYAGLGWYDPAEVFQCDPYERLLRRLPAVFGGSTELTADRFMAGLAEACPELDGGPIFTSVNAPYSPTSRRCTTGVSRALVELHLDGVIRLRCPSDSDGWWIDEAAPPRDREYILSDRVDRVVYCAAVGGGEAGK